MSYVAGGFAIAARWLFLLLFSLSLSSVSHAGGDSRTILIFGDSLSAAYGFDLERSWVSLLQKRLEDHNPAYRVVNASISGETTRGGAARIESVIARHEPVIVLVELGGNDGLRGIDLATTESNLDAIVERAKASGARVLLLGMQLPPNLGAAFNRRFVAIFEAVAERRDVPLVPFLLDGVGGVAELMQEDGIHPTAAAQPRMLDNVWPYLEPLL